MVTISSLSGTAYVNNATVSTQKSATASVGSSTAASVSDSAAAMTASPSDTSTESFSQVVADARAALDAGYKRLGKAGDEYTTGDQWNNTVGLKNMDRRTLYTIASNQGGQFSQSERDAAQITMDKQESDAMVAADPFNQDPAAAFKAAINYLDAGSPEEKASLQWAEARGGAECGYQRCMLEKDQTPEDVSTGNPVVDLFATAGFQLSKTNDPSKSVQDMPAYKQATKLWEELYGQGHTINLTV
jgi:hypothetical protein